MGGWDGNLLSSVEIFPRPPSNTCFIPDLPQPREDHSLSLISGVLIVCGGIDKDWNALDSCISWVAGNASWTPLYNMRCLPMMTLYNKLLIIKHNHSMARTRHTAWTPQSRPDSIMLLGGWYGDAAKLTAEIVPGDVFRGKLRQAYNISSQMETRLN